MDGEFLRYFRIKAGLSLALILLLPLFARLQVVKPADSLLIQDTAQRNAVKGTIKTSDTSVSNLIQRVEQFTLTINQYNYTLKRGFDTSMIEDRLPEIVEDIQIIQRDLKTYGKRVNLRSLHVNQVILTQMEKKLKEWQGILFRYYNQLVTMNIELGGMRYDSVLRNLPDDSTLKALYFMQLKELGKKWQLADSVNKINLKAIGLLQNRVASYYLLSNEILQEISFRIKVFGKDIFRNNDGSLWDKSLVNNSTDFWKIVQNSIRSLGDVLKYYIPLSWETRILNIAIFLAFFVWITYTINYIKKRNQNASKILEYANFIPKYPIVCSLVFILTLAPFMYLNPPAAYMVLQAFLLFILLTQLLWLDWPKQQRPYWVCFGILYLIGNSCNLLVEDTYQERWIIFLLAIATLGLALSFFRASKNFNVRYPNLTKFQMYLVIILNTGSILANFFGRFSLAKMLNTSSIYSLFLAIDLTVFVEIIMDAIYLQSETLPTNKGTSFYFNYDQVRKRLRRTLMLIAGGFWVVGFSKVMNFYDYFYDWAVEFLRAERKIGHNTFTFSSVLVFIIVVYISVLLTRLISFFFSDVPQAGGVKKNKLGSYMLIVKIAIFTIGLLIAFAASGIPTDKLAIVIGALGVGIGFGLQTVVNNLVSGIILAFEKPIQIGDIIEVGNRQGVVKEIGIRASKIATYDGSDVIIPNGDLLSQHLVNWTLNNSNRRVEIHVGVSYSSDQVKARRIIQDSIKGKKDVMQTPLPVILVNNFAESSVEYKIQFWTSDINNASQLRSDVMDDIYKGFKAEKIDIPFPQRDLHIKSVEISSIKDLKNEKAGKLSGENIPPESNS
ncbi:MAG: hypothetical protein C5B52_01410 [Bacteroidetes bacterium]|nr:MAG: hypothetical protein C5B52_01410 [Bacteroidota bacterium]